MTSLIVKLRTPDANRTFEVVTTFGDQIALAETAVEVYPDGRREWRDTRSTLLLVGRAPGAPA
jgi:hypothetical protein